MWSSTAGWNKRSSVPDQLLHGAPGLRSACFSLLLRVIVQCRTIVPIVHEHLRSLLYGWAKTCSATRWSAFKEFVWRAGDVNPLIRRAAAGPIRGLTSPARRNAASGGGGTLACVIFWFGLAVFAGSSPNLAAGEPPQIERLQPPGGQKGTTFDVKLVGKPGDGDVQLMSSTSSIQFALKESRDSATVTIPPETAAGVHWIRFVNDFGATELMPFVVGLIPEMTETEPNNRLTESNSAASPSVTLNGVLEKSGDVDCYAVALKSGQTLVASLQANRVLNSPMDGVLQLVNNRGTVLVQNDDDSGIDPLLSFTAPSDGTFYVRTFAFPAAPDSSIRFSGAPTYVYRLTLTTEAFADYCLPRVRSQADSETSLTLHGWNLANPSATLPDAFPRLGIGVMPIDVPFVDLRSMAESQLDADRVVAVAAAVSGVVEARDGDTFAIDATKGKLISLTVRAHEFASPLDPIVRIKDATGKVIQEADDINGGNPDSSVRFNPPADGRFTIHVSDRFRHFGDRYFYVLQIEEPRPSVRIETTKTGFVLPADKPLEIPLTITRNDGFAEPLDFKVEGLPEGITAEPVRSEKDGDSSKAVTIKLAGASAMPSRHKFSIRALTADGVLSHVATMSLPDRSETTELLLIVPVPPAPATPK